jgi:hypothetical protein
MSSKQSLQGGGEEKDRTWIPAGDAARLTAKLFGGLTRAQHALSVALREGILTTAAEVSAISEDEDADFKEEKSDGDSLLGVPSEVWNRSDNFDSDRLRWEWELGDFEVENAELGCTYIFQGVHFLESELADLDPALPVFRELGPSRNREVGMDIAVVRRRGPKSPHRKWSALIEAVLTLERDGQLVTTQYSRPSELLNDIRELIHPDLRLDDRTIDPIVSHIYAKLLCGPHRGN